MVHRQNTARMPLVAWFCMAYKLRTVLTVLKSILKQNNPPERKKERKKERETIWPVKPKIFTTWSFTKKVRWLTPALTTD